MAHNFLLENFSDREEFDSEDPVSNVAVVPSDDSIAEREKFIQYEIKTGALKHILCLTMAGADAKWTLFVIAARSRRYYEVLKPFPPNYMDDDGLPVEYDIQGLLHTIFETPPLKEVLGLLREGKDNVINVDAVQLLHWVLVEQRFPVLLPLKIDDFNELLENEKIGPKIKKWCLPTRAFKVQYEPNSPYELEFERYKNGSEVNFAFYGNCLDCFFSLLCHGFKEYRHTENKFFGKVLELFTTLETCKCYSPPDRTWRYSMCGDVLSCIALCEYIENQVVVEMDPSADSEGSVAPEKIRFPNSKMVRMRYLFFYEFIPKQGTFLPLQI